MIQNIKLCDNEDRVFLRLHTAKLMKYFIYQKRRELPLDINLCQI